MVENSKVKEMFRKLNEKLVNFSDIESADMLSGLSPKYWVKCNNKDYLFKYSNVYSDYTDFGEVFTSYLSYILGFNCVKAVFSKDLFKKDNDEVRGVLIESYRTKNVKESISLNSLRKKYYKEEFGYTPNEVMTMCRKFCNDRNLVLDSNMEQNLKDMALMDYLLLQTDRHAGNIEFLIEEKDNIKTLKLAPMFDNAYCLYLFKSVSEATAIYRYISRKECDITYNSNKNPMVNFYIKQDDTENDVEPEKIVVRDLACELLKNKKLMGLYKNFLKLDFKKEVDFIRSIYKKKLPEIHYNLILKGVENRVKALNAELVKQMNEKEIEIF